MTQPKPRKLTAKERLFVAEYLVDRNAAHAAIRCGYSKHTAKQIGHEVLHKPHVLKAIEERMLAMQKKLEVTQESVVQRAKEIAEAGMGPPNVSALGLLFDFLGLRRRKVEHTGTDGGPIMIITGVPDKEAKE